MSKNILSRKDQKMLDDMLYSIGQKPANYPVPAIPHHWYELSKDNQPYCIIQLWPACMQWRIKLENSDWEARVITIDQEYKDFDDYIGDFN